MKKISLFLLLISVFFAGPTSTHAETVLRTGSDVSVEADQIVDGDYYVSAGPFGTTVMSGSVMGDMYAMGAQVTVNGEVGQDTSILAGSAQLHAPVSDDVRIIAGDVTLAEDVGGDVFVIAGSLSVLSTAKVTGDIMFFGDTLSIEGDVEGSVLGKAQSINIDSHIGGDVDVIAKSILSLGDDATIDGFVQYTSFAQIGRGQGSVVVGEIVKNEYTAATTREQTRTVLIPIFITLFATLSLYLLFKKELELLVIAIENQFAKNALIGSVVALLGPIVALLLIVTVLGLLIGLVTLSLVVLLYVAGIALSNVVLGAFVSKLFTKKLEVTLITILVGVIATQVLLFIPILGPLALYVIFAVTVGSITRRLYQHFA